MKAGIHPESREIQVTCSCGNALRVVSTLSEDLQIEICSKCHPFSTGQQKIRTGDRITRFRKRFGDGKPPRSGP